MRYWSIDMSSFVLNYGAQNGSFHVEIDWTRPLPVSVYGLVGSLPEFRGSMEAFARIYPSILQEMLTTGALRAT